MILWFMFSSLIWKQSNSIFGLVLLHQNIFLNLEGQGHKQLIQLQNTIYFLYIHFSSKSPLISSKRNIIFAWHFAEVMRKIWVFQWWYQNLTFGKKNLKVIWTHTFNGEQPYNFVLASLYVALRQNIKNSCFTIHIPYGLDWLRICTRSLWQ